MVDGLQGRKNMAEEERCSHCDSQDAAREGRSLPRQAIGDTAHEFISD